MTRRVLISGPAGRASALAERFAAVGIEQVLPSELGQSTSVVHYYIQLGVTVPAHGDTVVQRVHSFLKNGLLDRYLRADQVLPMLADDAVVLLVAGNLPSAVATPDDQVARLALLRVLAHAMRADLAPRRVRISVISGGRSDEEVAGFALTGEKDELAEMPLELNEDTSSRSYDDWRTQVMGLAHLEV